MTTKYKIIIIVAALLTAFAFGRFSAPTKVVTKIQTVEVEKKQENQDAKEHEVVTIVKKPDGTSTTTITKNEDTKTQETSTNNTDISEEKTVTKSGSRITVSALAGLSVSSLSSAPVYGLSVSKTILGPIAIGAFGFSNGLGGISLGLNF